MPVDIVAVRVEVQAFSGVGAPSGPGMDELVGELHIRIRGDSVTRGASDAALCAALQSAIDTMPGNNRNATDMRDGLQVGLDECVARVARGEGLR